MRAVICHPGAMNAATAPEATAAARMVLGRPSLAELSGGDRGGLTASVLQRVLPGDRSRETEVAAFGSSI